MFDTLFGAQNKNFFIQDSAILFILQQALFEKIIIKRFTFDVLVGSGPEYNLPGPGSISTASIKHFTKMLPIKNMRNNILFICEKHFQKSIFVMTHMTHDELRSNNA